MVIESAVFGLDSVPWGQEEYLSVKDSRDDIYISDVRLDFFGLRKKRMHLYSGGRLQIENEVGHDEWEGAMLLWMYENLPER